MLEWRIQGRDALPSVGRWQHQYKRPRREGDASMLEQQKNETLTPVDLRLSNGDTITKTLLDGWGITVRDGEPVPGLFDPDYMPLLSTDADREANHA